MFTFLDTTIQHWIQNHQLPTVEYHLTSIKALGNNTNIFLIALMVAGYFAYCKCWGRMLLFIACLGLTGITVHFLRHEVDRERPCCTMQLTSQARSPSFPSGHSAGTMCCFLMAALSVSGRVRRFWVPVAVLASVMVGISRLYSGSHWFSDVLAGWLIGALFAGVYALCMRREVPVRTAQSSPEA